jgi:hypothetical protein
LTTYFSSEDDFYITMTGNSGNVPIFWIQEDRMFGTLTVQNTPLTPDVIEEIAAFH